MDTGASSHLNSSVNNLSTIFNSRIYPSVLVGDGKSIPVTNTGHSTLPTPYRTLHLNNVLITPNIVKNLISVRQFVRENKCTIEFDEFGFSVKDFWTRQILLRCDSTGDLYPVTSPSYPQAFLVGQQTWHQRLGHPGSEVLREDSFSLSETIVKAPFDIIHSDLWTSPLTSVSGSLYGLKQAPRAWFQRFAAYAARVGFHHSRCDSSLFIYRQGADTAYLLLYVDDIVLTASSSDLLQQIITSLHAEFSMTDLGSLNYFLGISVTRNASGMFLSQQKYATEVLDRAGMLNCKPCRTPVDTDSKLSADGAPISDSTLYRSLAGALQYLTFTRPDISYAVQQVCLFMHDPREPHLSALKRILRAEAEYRGVANAVAETCWLRNLLRELHTPLATATLVYCDNVSAVYLSSNPVQHQRTKHIEIDIHFVRDLVATGAIRVLHVPSRYQYADIFTKGLPTSLFDNFRTSLSVRSSPAPTAGGCKQPDSFSSCAMIEKMVNATLGLHGV
ncbi:ribonuclease H-like domain-containing protein [Tanacetum coccineum]